MPAQTSMKRRRQLPPEPIDLDKLYGSSQLTGLVSFLENIRPEDVQRLSTDTAPTKGTGPTVDTVPPMDTVATESTVLLVDTASEPTWDTVPTEDTVLTVDTVPNKSTVLEEIPTNGTVPIVDTVAPEGVRRKPAVSSHRAGFVHAGAIALELVPPLGPSKGTVSTEETVPRETPIDRVEIGRQTGGRPVTNIHLLRTAQDGHSMAEDAMYRKLWDGAAEQGSDAYRAIEIGYERAGALLHINKSGAKRLILALIDKLSLEIVKGQNSDERIGKQYRVYSFGEINRRRRNEGFTHFQRNRGGVQLIRRGAPTRSTVPTESTGTVPTAGHPF